MDERCRNGRTRARLVGTRRRAWSVAAAAAIVVLVAACSGSAGLPEARDAGPGGGATTVGSTGSGGTVGAPVVQGGETGAFPEPAASAPALDGSEAGTPSQAVGNGAQDDARIIRTGTLTLEVAKLEDALTASRTRIAALGGYVSGSDESNDGDRTRATIVYRIPADRWDDALDALRGLASKVVGEQTSAVEVTGQVLDLDARIRNLRATESALQAIMAKATKIGDILDVQGQLTVVRGEIEQLSTEKAHLEDQAALGTLTVSFAVPVPAVTTTREGWDPAAEVDRAVASLVGMFQGLASFGIWLAIVGLPILVAVGLVLLVLAFVARRSGLPRRRGPGPLPPVSPPIGPPVSPAPGA